ncbi:MAG: DUF4160 domain-containing protein [Oscillospiraceae bacterium]|nr:DUF4160 domain-containing protein [Oscillospiraceae bacterium]
MVSVLSMFYGILIKMHWGDMGQRGVPHFHAFYGDEAAVFVLEGDILAGRFPTKQAALVRAWALIHADELAADWTLAANRKEIFRIDPLR